MVRLYSSYLMRLWCLEEGELRIKLEHVQSGEKVQVESFDEAVAWVERRAQGPPTLTHSEVEEPGWDAYQNLATKSRAVP